MGDGERAERSSGRRGGPRVAPRKGEGPAPRDVECEKCRGGEGVGEGLVRRDLPGETFLSLEDRRGEMDVRGLLPCLGDGVGESPRAAIADGPALKGDFDT